MDLSTEKGEARSVVKARHMQNLRSSLYPCAPRRDSSSKGITKSTSTAEKHSNMKPSQAGVYINISREVF